MDAAGLARASTIVRAGGVLIYPTETVYGIGGDAQQPEVVRRVLSLKGRADEKPMLVLTDEWARVRGWLGRMEPAHTRFMEHDPPLALTLLLPAGPSAPSWLIGPDGLVGVRRTTDAFCRALVAAADVPLLSTSANLAGQPAPARFAEVHASLLKAVDLALDAGRSLAGVPSTVVRVEHGHAVVVREGAVSAEAVAQIAAGEGAG